MRDREFIAQAKEFATSYVVEALLADIEAKHVEVWKTSQAIEDREACFQMVRAIQALRSELVSVASSEEIAVYNRRLRGAVV